MKIFPSILILSAPLLVSATSLRIEGDRAWLKAEGAPLPKVLNLFEQRGVDVFIDPSLELGRISGEWENVKIERLIAQLTTPHSYLLEWRSIEGPLGDLYQISSIRIFSDGNASAAQRLTSRRKVLDVVEGKDGGKNIRGEIMVGFKEGTKLNKLKALLAKLGGTVIEVINPPGIYRIRLGDNISIEDAVAIAQKDPNVMAAEPNRAFRRLGNEHAPEFGTGPGANLHLQPGETAVAVFDSGLDPKYADLPFIRGTYDALDPSAEISDPSGHGTLMALIASGAITPLGAERSEAGVPVLSVRMFDENGYTSNDTIMRALQYAANSGVKIVSMSWGSEVDSRFMKTALDYAAQNGMILFAAAGNQPTGIPVYPAAYDSVHAVGGLNPDGTRWERSNYGDFIDFYGPAKFIFDGKIHSGTSPAAQRIAFKAALQMK